MSRARKSQAKLTMTAAKALWWAERARERGDHVGAEAWEAEAVKLGHEASAAWRNRADLA